MVVAEILTGIALVQKSVEFIKSNISTVNDIKGIAKQIDGFFLGEEQMNKEQGKGMSIAEQFGSVENSANDFINRKLLEEKREELKFIINMRFGPTTWDQIIAERAAKINKAKEAVRLQKVEARQKQKEIVDTLQTMAIIFCVIAVFIIGLVVTFKAFAYEYKSKQLTRQQKINQGLIKEPKLVLCRLKKQKVYKGKVACIYQGANKTFELSFQDVRIGCVKNFRCVLNPNGSEPSIDKVMESLRSIAK
ncbi:hypothetical protein OAM56_07000 [Alphaproteobacteria bacterium]|nr:hypothetical protein [Alphaproteobacteria bacterium]